MRFYFNHRRSTDFVLGVLVALSVYFQPIRAPALFLWPTGGAFQSFMLAVSGSSVTLVGFVLAASTFLITHTGQPRFAVLRESAGYGQLLEIVRSTMWRLIALTIFGGVGALTGVIYQQAALSTLSFFVIWALCGIVTLIWSTLSILGIRTD